MVCTILAIWSCEILTAWAMTAVQPPLTCRSMHQRHRAGVRATADSPTLHARFVHNMLVISVPDGTRRRCTTNCEEDTSKSSASARNLSSPTTCGYCAVDATRSNSCTREYALLRRFT
ncbi:hypothetical protein OH76DRAFT_260296 [Lentinus brumalis]|uniref:Secreted protein n=1 Tax=Lentinus brumalis TaxID=2498619 RepID=A0A371DGG1_9APHY|nr:hypothetical protein OH76DRAFT_260296 [Polyporus brumalis]